MITPTNVQIISQNGAPAFVVIPYMDFVREFPHAIPVTAPQPPRIPEGDYVPHEVVGLVVKYEYPLIRAWREYLGLTQAEVAQRAGITQAALSQMENGDKKLRKATREKVAKAMGLNPQQVW